MINGMKYDVCFKTSYADMAELADAGDSNSPEETHMGSSPIIRTQIFRYPKATDKRSEG